MECAALPRANPQPFEEGKDEEVKEGEEGAEREAEGAEE